MTNMYPEGEVTQVAVTQGVVAIDVKPVGISCCKFQNALKRNRNWNNRRPGVSRRTSSCALIGSERMSVTKCALHFGMG